MDSHISVSQEKLHNIIRWAACALYNLRKGVGYTKPNDHLFNVDHELSVVVTLLTGVEATGLLTSHKFDEAEAVIVAAKKAVNYRAPKKRAPKPMPKAVDAAVRAVAKDSSK